MSGVLIHDGRRVGHRKWSVDAVRTGHADGIMLSPFATPRVAEPRHPSAITLASEVSDAGGEVIFDAMTHARFLPSTNKTDFYNQWELWGASVGVDSAAKRLDHVERVFARQSALDCPHLAPTIQLTSPLGLDAAHALELAQVSRGLDRSCWQSLVGTRAFFESGANLDAYVGSLSSLRSPVWVLTLANELVLDHMPDLTNIAAWAGFCRTVRSLSLRSRVIISYGDFAGLPAVAAGADTLGSGWDRAQKTFDPLAFKLNSDEGIRIPASYVTQGRLNAVLRRDAADAIERWNAVQAGVLRGGIMPRTDQEQRMHHLLQLRSAVQSVDSKSSHKGRVDELRARYSFAQSSFDTLIARLPGIIKAQDKSVWGTSPSRVLEAYATAEGL
ncbi:hypothetical protein [Rhodococcus sp. 1139]|uniref:hypothetical protein n=1 Tax=Rhodococcus sp. 1139 TaxID=1833762 RepID=UPI00114CB34E|nr:hypothetical protein [Rhodococcus sp. 1139]